MQKALISTSLTDVAVPGPCYSGDSVLWCTLALLAVLGLAESAQGHSKLLQEVQASTRLPRWCRLTPNSPDGAGWLQAPQKVQAGSRLPRWCRLLSPGVSNAPGVTNAVFHGRLQMVQAAPGVSRLGVPVGRSSPGGAGVVSRWCRVHQVSPGVVNPLGRVW